MLGDSVYGPLYIIERQQENPYHWNTCYTDTESYLKGREDPSLALQMIVLKQF